MVKYFALFALLLAVPSPLLLADSSTGSMTNQPSPQAKTPPPPALDGFLGLKWRDPKDTVNKSLSAKYSLAHTDGDLYVYNVKGVKIAGEPADTVSAVVTDQGLTKMSLWYKRNQVDDDVLPQYDRLKALLIAKYGAPTHDIKTFESPYTDGDGFATDAIEEGKGNYIASWELQSSTGEACMLGLQILPDLQVAITYENEPLMKAYADEKSKKDTSQL